MTDPEKSSTAKAAWDAEAARKLGAELAKALEVAGSGLKVWADDSRKSSEAAALFALYRQLRRLDGRSSDLSTEERHARQAELRARMDAAIKGYDVTYLAELATFGGWLDDAAGKEWRSRT